MEAKELQPVDKLAFVQSMYDYCGRNTNSLIRKQFAGKMGCAEKSFNNKMYSTAPFRGQELDLVDELYRQVLGDDVYTKLFRDYLSRAANGDYRTIENAKGRAIDALTHQREDSKEQTIAALDTLNEELATAHIFL